MTTAPLSDEIEVSLFGPGYGECVVVHLSQNNWIIIDSCVLPGTDQPAALDYFSRIGIDPSTAVKMVVATHWHDDHFRGIGTLFKHCSNAKFYCSSALQPREFLELVHAYTNRSMTESSGLEEFNYLIKEMQRRQTESPESYTGPQFVAADQTLLQTNFIDNTGNPRACSIHALSPSSAAILKSTLQIGSLLPSSHTTKATVIPPSTNLSAIVILINIGGICILLGADLQEDNGPQGAWSTILASTVRPQIRATVYKVAHHGSPNGDHSGIWATLLEPNPIAMLTCFSRGPRPSKKDVERICSYSTDAFSTTKPGATRKLKREQIVEKMIKETAKDIRLINGYFGQTRCRKKAGNDWRVDLFGDAVHLCKHA